MPIKRFSLFIFSYFLPILILFAQEPKDFDLIFEVNMSKAEKTLLINEISSFKNRIKEVFGKKKNTTTAIYFKSSLSTNRFQEWGVGFFLPSENAIYLNMGEYEDRKNFYTVLKHEIVHSWSYDFHNGRNIWPLWFEEGLAQFLSGKEINYSDASKLSTAFINKKILAQDSLLSLHHSNKYKIELFYLQSLFIVRSIHSRGMLDKYIKGKFWDHQGGPPFGFKDWVDFEIWWQTELESNFKWYIFLNFDVSLAILFVILFLAVYIIKSFKNRRRLREMAQKETDSNPIED